MVLWLVLPHGSCISVHLPVMLHLIITSIQKSPFACPGHQWEIYTKNSMFPLMCRSLEPGSCPTNNSNCFSSLNSVLWSQPPQLSDIIVFWLGSTILCCVWEDTPGTEPDQIRNITHMLSFFSELVLLCRKIVTLYILSRLREIFLSGWVAEICIGF